MAKSLKGSSRATSINGRKEYLAQVASSALSQKTRVYGMSSNSKTGFVKASSIMDEAPTSSILTDTTEIKSFASSTPKKLKTKRAKIRFKGEEL